jgi:hypothetical protein
MLDLDWREDGTDKGLDLHWCGEGYLFKEDEFQDEVILHLDWDEVDALISLALAYRELKSTKARLGLPLLREGGGGGGGNEGNEELDSNYGGTK